MSQATNLFSADAEQLGALAGGELDALAHDADINPPTLEHRTRRGEDQQRIVKHPSYVELEKVAFAQLGLAATSHRGATAVRAVPDAATPGAYRLYGDKWFCFNPDAALAMVLARIDGAPAGMKGVSLFTSARSGKARATSSRST